MGRTENDRQNSEYQSTLTLSEANFIKNGASATSGLRSATARGGAIYGLFEGYSESSNTELNIGLCNFDDNFATSSGYEEVRSNGGAISYESANGHHHRRCNHT